MSEHLLIDANNLMHAMRSHAPMPHVGRETLFRVIDRAAVRNGWVATLVFDGGLPREGVVRQMTSKRVAVRFAAPQSADDVICDIVKESRRPSGLRVITGDGAVRHAAVYRKCAHTDAVGFVAELFDERAPPAPRVTDDVEKPADPSNEETDEWIRLFGMDESGETRGTDP